MQCYAGIEHDVGDCSVGINGLIDASSVESVEAAETQEEEEEEAQSEAVLPIGRGALCSALPAAWVSTRLSTVPFHFPNSAADVDSVSLPAFLPQSSSSSSVCGVLPCSPRPRSRSSLPLLIELTSATASLFSFSIRTSTYSSTSYPDFLFSCLLVDVGRERAPKTIKK